MTLFQGISAFPITPADADGCADPAALRRLLDRLVAARVDSVGLLGSTGGYAYLGLAERQRVLDLALARVDGQVPVVTGVGALRTADAVALARHAERAGANGVLLAPVSYTPLTDDEVFQHFAAVSEAAGLPLCIYNNPSTTHFSFSVPLLARLAHLPNICAVKMPLPGDGDFAGEIGRLRDALPPDFVIGYSGDWGAAPSLLAGADAFFSVAAGLLPEPFLRLGRAAMSGDATLTGRIDAAFGLLWSLFRDFGSLRVVYAAANKLGLSDAQPPLPILPLPETQDDRLREALEALPRP